MRHELACAWARRLVCALQGELVLGDTVVPMYVDQSREALDPNKTVRYKVIIFIIFFITSRIDLDLPFDYLMMPHKSHGVSRTALCGVTAGVCWVAHGMGQR